MCLLTQWNAAEAKLYAPMECAVHGKRFCLSLLLHPSLSRCCISVQSQKTSYEAQNNRTGDKTGSNLKSVLPQAREHCDLVGSSQRRWGNMEVGRMVRRNPERLQFQSQVKAAQAEMQRGR